jgi:Fe-S cluster assembly ATP-binding protein
MINGRIVKTGGAELIEKIDKEGYSWIEDELGINIDPEKEQKTHAILGACAHNPKN